MIRLLSPPLALSRYIHINGLTKAEQSISYHPRRKREREREREAEAEARDEYDEARRHVASVHHVIDVATSAGLFDGFVSFEWSCKFSPSKKYSFESHVCVCVCVFDEVSRR